MLLTSWPRTRRVILCALLSSGPMLLAGDTWASAVNNASDGAWLIQVVNGGSPSKGVCTIGLAKSMFIRTLSASAEYTLEKKTAYQLLFEPDADGRMVQFLKLSPKDGPAQDWTTIKVQLVKEDGTPTLLFLRVAYSNPKFENMNRPANYTDSKMFDAVVELSNKGHGPITIREKSYSEKLPK